MGDIALGFLAGAIMVIGIVCIVFIEVKLFGKVTGNMVIGIFLFITVFMALVINLMKIEP